MKKSRFTHTQILVILKQAENGVPVPELCRQHGMSSASFYKWCYQVRRYGRVADGRLKGLEQENSRLKKMYAGAQLRAEVVQEALAKK